MRGFHLLHETLRLRDFTRLRDKLKALCLHDTMSLDAKVGRIMTQYGEFSLDPF